MTNPIRKLTEAANRITVNEVTDAKPKDIAALKLAKKPAKLKQNTNANMMTNREGWVEGSADDFLGEALNPSDYDPKNPKFIPNMVKELQRLGRIADNDGTQAMVDLNKLANILKTHS
jgi:hypothetical protein